MNALVTKAATVAATYIVSGQYSCDTIGAHRALTRASDACGLSLGPIERAQATAAVLRQSSSLAAC
jgi:predicted lysophospholipase L1 biosynthesis ABC-type transport system permease subunit